MRHAPERTADRRHEERRDFASAMQTAALALAQARAEELAVERRWVVEQTDGRLFEYFHAMQAYVYRQKKALLGRSLSLTETNRLFTAIRDAWPPYALENGISPDAIARPITIAKRDG